MDGEPREKNQEKIWQKTWKIYSHVNWYVLFMDGNGNMAWKF